MTNNTNGIDVWLQREGFSESIDESIINEAVDVKKIIEELRDTDFKGSNEEQMKGLQLLKGLATSDEELANKFMNSLSDAFTSVAKKVLGE